MALVKVEKPSPRKLSPKQVAYACQRMREMLLDSGAGYGKQLLGLLVTEIRVKPGTVTMTGSTAVLNNAVSEMKLGTPFCRKRQLLINISGISMPKISSKSLFPAISPRPISVN